MMNKERIYEIAEAAGFEKAACIGTEELFFVPEYRIYCEQNLCGNYGNNYACPPHCGTPQEMEEKVKAYKHALVFQTCALADDPYSNEETKPLKRAHTQMTLEVLKELKAEGLDKDGFPIMCGPCNFCKTCGQVSGKPCVNEEMCFSCLSAYCIDAGKMAEACGMKIEWHGNLISFFSIYVYGKV